MSGKAELARLDPLGVINPKAVDRWREKQKMLAQHLEEHTYRDEKLKLQGAYEALADEESELTDEEKIEALRSAVDDFEALGLDKSEVFEYWHDKASSALELLLRQVACKAKLEDATKVMSKFKLRRALKNAHDAKLNSANCSEAQTGKKTLQRLQKMDREPLYESEEDVPAMTEDEMLLYRLTYHSGEMAPSPVAQQRPFKERVTAIKVAIEAADAKPKLPYEEYVFLDDFRRATGWEHWGANDGWDDFLEAPEDCMGLTVFFNQFNGMGTITDIRISNNKLNGTIPDTIGRLQNLTVLKLPMNELGGLIPPELGSCKSLADVDLSSNAFYGAIPAEVGQCLQLGTLILNHNRLSGTVPRSLCGLNNLAGIGLKSNFFTEEEKHDAQRFLFEHFGVKIFTQID
jgi:anti-sigma28 factor (negative regulator of flagellin synthesis)